MKTTLQSRGWTTALAMAAVLLLAAPVARAAAPLATVSISPQGLEWQPAGDFEKFTLTVSGPGGVTLRREIQSGAALAFEPVGDDGKPLADGIYAYELTATPRLDLQTRQALAAAHLAGDEAAIAKLQAAGKLPRAPLAQSGFFTIHNGALVSPDAKEGRPAAPRTTKAMTPITPKDVVTPDDAIIQGSLCVGLDCVNNESFGFDTIRLKENNTRIKFEDTSVGTFPTHDWQLTANDSASGGAEKFSIEDITAATVPFTVSGSAPTNSIFVDSTGRLGLRTATPVLDIHVNTSNTPAIRLEQNNSGGFTAQTWDVAGNEANFFVRDVTGGSRLPFRIRPGAPTSSIDINASGDVGIGTASPSEKLHVLENVNANTFLLVENPNSGTSSAAVLRTQSDGAQLNFQSHSSTRTISRFGKVLGGWTELLSLGTANGLAMGTVGAVPLVLGTNSTNRLEIGGTGGVTVTGNFTVTGGTKNFAVIDPADSKRAIYFAALEGPEAGTYFRGTAKMKGGEAVIELPGYFSRVTEAERMTVQLTPIGNWGQMYVAEKSPTRLVVRAAPGTTDLEFDFLVQGVRKGYLDYEVERTNTLPQ
ncbi:MAG TPA: hypothetical protein VGS07_32335 [Thermoanaerobaculia bacterium]|jgi:hypothetical protein|nr:hypothetical protein [Thermoanaerobaculia bacterium]